MFTVTFNKHWVGRYIDIYIYRYLFIYIYIDAINWISKKGHITLAENGN